MLYVPYVHAPDTLNEYLPYFLFNEASIVNIVSPKIEEYARQHTTPRPTLFDRLVEVTFDSMELPHMQVGHLEGTFLKLLCSLTGARRILELGTFTGFSALCMAEALPEDGELITCDIDLEALEIARSFFAQSPHGKKITIRLGDALEIVHALPEEALFDIVFLDANKERYPEYYEAVLPRIRKNGLLIADNTLWGGGVLSPNRFSDHALATFNRRVADDPRVENVLLTVRDGIMLARKL